ncbi:MAG TPA: Npt1/Npt2 family nucleotide transporter [Chlamydiales bacterium]|nr:Npt1/Npt2 family nucleotide transporter [Chlamydiales bacterium]
MKVSFLKDRTAARLFLLMFGIVCLLNVSYTILRSARNALTVADLGGGAGAIPWFELCGTMPGAVIMTLILTYLLNRHPIHRVFFIVLTTFVGFFLLFSLVIYPLLPFSKTFFTNPSIASAVPVFASMIFFVMAELWKIALLTVLFWGLVNQYVPLENAKRYYAPLMLGGSIGTIIAGPIISFCTADTISHHSWSESLALLMWALTALSLIVAWLFSRLWGEFSQTQPKKEAPKEKKETLSVWSSILICCRSRYLLLLAWVTIADYIAYALGEIIFLDLLKQKFPDPREYCDFMGKLSVWNGILTAVSALIITPYLLKRCRWVVASLVTPVCLLLTEGAFFFSIWHPALASQLEILVILGSIFFCVVRAAKYTLFDTSKEISFVLLPPLEKMQGKLVVDGMCARLGRGSGSFLTLALIQICGSVLATAPIAGGIALLIAFSCVIATSHLGVLVEKKTPIADNSERRA